MIESSSVLRQLGNLVVVLATLLKVDIPSQLLWVVYPPRLALVEFESEMRIWGIQRTTLPSGSVPQCAFYNVRI